MNYPDESVYIQCDCHSHDHLLVAELAHFPLEDGGDRNMFSFGVQMNHYLPWWRRIWVAIKYAFGGACDYGHWDCVIVTHENALALEGLLMTYLKRVNNNE